MGTKKTVSLCMIVKNEEATLEKAIRSVLPFVDEIVIGIDETTTDRSEDIAKEFTLKVYRFKWQSNFAQARNRMLVHCTKDWILQLDGHEYLDEKCAPLFAKMLENIPDDDDAVGLRLKMQEDDGNYSGIQLRLFRNNSEICYRNSVHNVLTVDDVRTIGFSDIIIRHERPKQNRDTRNDQRNRMVPEEMQKILQEDPCDTRAMYYVALHAQDAGDYGRAIVYYRRYLAFSKHAEERYKVLWQMGRSLYLFGKKDEARKTFIQGMTERYNLAECYVSLGELAMEEQKWGEAEHYFKLACGRRMPMSGVFFSEDFYSWLPYHKLCELYDHSGEYYRAICAGEELLKQEKLPEERRREVEARMFHWYGNILDNGKVEYGTPDRKNVLIVDKTGQFTKELKVRLSEKYNVILIDCFSPQHCKWANVIWFDWCDENLVAASQMPQSAHIAAMLRSYEYFTDFPSKVNWRNIDRVMFVSETMKNASLKKFPMMKQAECEVLRDGVDLNRFKFSERSNGQNIAWVGYLNHKKNVPLLLELASANRGYQFHIAGTFQDERLEEYVRHYMAVNRLDNLHLHGWVDDMNGFLEGMNYVLSTSLWEGTHLSVLEGMAKGIKPLVHYWSGAEEQYCEEWLFRNGEEFTRMLTEEKYDSAAYRRHVEEKFSMEMRLVRAEAVIEELLKEKGEVEYAELQH